MTLSRAALQRSRPSERLSVNPQGDTSIAKIEVTEAESQEWRVTLGRVDPGNGHPPLVPGSTVTAFSSLIRSNLYQYSAGRLVTPANPPRRDNPCAPPNGSDVDPLFVQIAFGQGSAGLQRFAANWPVQGGAVVVVGSYVEVFATTFLGGVAAGDLPRLTATITPTDGADTEDSCELSLQDLVPLDSTNIGSVVGVPEFARRVRVAVMDSTQGTAGQGRIPITGDPRCIGEWFDDQGNVVDGWIQGATVGASATVWKSVPSRAVLLRLFNPGPNLDCGETFGNVLSARVHWRIAP